jgi:hypothetical protein
MLLVELMRVKEILMMLVMNDADVGCRLCAAAVFVFAPIM